MVLFKETEAEGVAIGRMAEDAISGVFIDRGFKLVDAETVGHSLGHDEIMGLLAGNERVATVVKARLKR